ncbi:MAG: hypothetical protein PSN46_07150 [Gammaproteobacteria bacterium]|nr:hypothetical protein [Gammaproteobacteria bacterium]
MSKVKTRWLKPLLVLGLLVIAYAGFSQYQATLNANHMQRVPEFLAAGESYGQLHDQNECLQETFRQAAGCTNFSCGVYYGKFFKACLEVASSNLKLCKGVPKFTEKKDQKTKDWLRNVCFERPEANTCKLLMRQVQLQCSSK